jgi:hypothetical protein
MPRSQTLVALLAVLAAVAPASGQILDDALVPRGAARFELSPVFTSWDSRFGRTANGTNVRESLSDDLTTQAAHTLFPGAESLRSAIAALSGNAGYAPGLGTTQGYVTQDITRVEFGGHLGVFDWLTVGAVLPWSRTRTSVDVNFRSDSINGDLGQNPLITNSGGVTSFLQALGSAQAATAANATQVCGGSPGSGACTNAQALAARTADFNSTAVTAYGSSGFFPAASTTTAFALASSVASLSSDLVAAGLAPISVTMPFATERVREVDYWSMPQFAASGVGAIGPIASLKGPWHAGDLEVSATIRLLEGQVRSTPEAEPSFTYRVLATALGRLPTGQVDSVDVILDVGTGDGQADMEGRLFAQVTVGRRLGLQVGGRYGVQRPRTLLRRIVPPEQVLSYASTRQTVEWTPGDYYGIEIAPLWRISGELSVAAEYRAFRKHRDDYELVGPSAGAPFDTSVLEVESGVTVHEVGGSLRYDTLARWLGEGARPLQVNFRVARAVAGGGGQTPVTTQVEFGVRLFRRIWGS